MPDTHKGAQQNSGNSPSTGDVKDKAKQVVGQAQEAAKPVLDQVKQGADQLAQQAKEHYGKISEGAVAGYRKTEGTIARNPAPAMLIGFGVGFGLGVVICSLLTQKEETWQEKYLPDSLKKVPDQYDALVSKIKKAPDHYESLIDSLKELPQTVQQYLPKSVTKFLS